MDENSTVNFLVSRKSECKTNYLSYRRLTGGSHVEYDTLSFEDYEYFFTKNSYCGECRGLLYFGRTGDALLCNPTTKELKILPASPIPLPEDSTNCYVFYTCCGFGYDANSEDFKVLRIFERHYYRQSRSRDFVVELYEFSTNTWKEIKYPGRLYNCSNHFGVHLNGTLYWIASFFDFDDDVLLSFDLATEEFSTSSLPFQRTAASDEYNYCQDLHVVDGKLASFVYLNPKYYPKKSIRNKSIIRNMKRIRNKKRNKNRIIRKGISNKRIRIRVWEEGMWKEVFNMAFGGVVTPLGMHGHLLFLKRHTKTVSQLQVYDLLTEKLMRLDVHDYDDKMQIFPYNQSQYRITS